jgi:hypothetical protein
MYYGCTGTCTVAGALPISLGGGQTGQAYLSTNLSFSLRESRIVLMSLWDVARLGEEKDWRAGNET